jgi:glycosyltransferase involved in cell wall biosynthesis
MRILLDYRPALKARSGVGEWVHELARAILGSAGPRTGANPSVDLTLFTSSWKDRPSAASRAELSGARFIDRRVPVALLNLAWNRLGWPPVELLTGETFDVVMAPHPLLLPARGGLKVITIHDLDFLDHPERTRAEIRRDYPALVREHAARADLVVVVSEDTARQVESRLGVSRARMVLCGSGVPAWIASAPTRDPVAGRGYILFVGTLNARKNIKGLLDAYSLLVGRRPDAPRLVLIGRETPEAGPWLEAARAGPLAGRVDVLGYLSESERRLAYLGARMLVLPSFHEGFGIPALEAMALGVPVVASNRGALPEVVGEAGLLVDPDDASDIARGIDRLLNDGQLWRECVSRGRLRARGFTWDASASRLLERLRQCLDQPGSINEKGRP